MTRTCLKCGYLRQAGDAAPDYECPQCGAVYAKVEAALKARGEKAIASGNDDQVEAERARSSPANSTSESSSKTAESKKTCPFCGEEILAIAKKCRHCKSFLDESNPTKPPHAKASHPIGNRGLAKCKSCGREVSKTAKSCPHCGQKDPGIGVKEMLMGLAVLIFISIAMVGWFGGESDSSPRASPSSSSRDNSTMAYIQCKSHVIRRLKAPSTADFPFLDYSSSDVGGNRYIVRSYVDAQNGFGAMLRNRYRCEIRYDGGDSASSRSWTLVSLTMS